MIQNRQIERLALSAMLIAMAVVLDMFPLFRAPFGGSVTLLSMAPILLLARKYGIRWGFICGFVFAFMQLALGAFGRMGTWGLSPTVFIASLILDYFLAYSVLGLGGLFRRKSIENNVLWPAASTTIALTARFLCHFIAGVALWGAFAPEGQSVIVYSILYNGAYMLPELGITLLGMVLLLNTPVIGNYFSPEKA